MQLEEKGEKGGREGREGKRREREERRKRKGEERKGGRQGRKEKSSHRESTFLSSFTLGTSAALVWDKKNQPFAEAISRLNLSQE